MFDKKYTIPFLIGIIPIILWIFQMPLLDRFAGFSSTLRSLGQLSGLVGISFFALVLILSARLKFFEKIFGSLSNAYNIHHNLGGVSLVLLLIHPISLMLAYIPVSIKFATNLILDISNWSINFGKISLALMIILLIITFFFKIAYQKWKLTHKFLGLAFFIGGLHAFLIPSDVSSNIWLRYYILGFSLIAILAYIYRTVFYSLFVKKYNYLVKGIKSVARGTTEIILEPARDEIKAEAGQYIFVSFQDDLLGREVHPFSLVSARMSHNLIFAAKELGDYTSLLKNLRLGTKAKIEGPYGKFNFNNRNYKNQVWIAGGIGITPFVSLARSLTSDYKVTLFYTFKNEEEAAYLNELKEIARINPNLSIIPWNSSHLGNMNVESIKNHCLDLNQTDFYICGPVPMMNAFKNQLKQSGVFEKNIISEEFSLYS